MDWIMYTIGVVAHIWATLTIVGIITLFDTPQVKSGLRTVQLSGKIYIQVFYFLNNPNDFPTNAKHITYRMYCRLLGYHRRLLEY